MPLVRRVAFLSLHTSPMEQPGSGDAGGMNVYVRALAAALAETGVEVEIFTRSTAAGQPAVEHPSPGVCVHNVLAGPPRKLPKEELPALLHSMVAEIDRIKQLQPHGRYDVVHSHYWVSGVAGLELSELWGCRWYTPCTPWPRSRTCCSNPASSRSRVGARRANTGSSTAPPG